MTRQHYARRNRVRRSLRRAGGHLGRAAELLGLTQAELKRELLRLGIGSRVPIARQKSLR